MGTEADEKGEQAKHVEHVELPDDLRMAGMVLVQALMFSVDLATIRVELDEESRTFTVVLAEEPAPGAIPDSVFGVTVKTRVEGA